MQIPGSHGRAFQRCPTSKEVGNQRWPTSWDISTSGLSDRHLGFPISAYVGNCPQCQHMHARPKDYGSISIWNFVDIWPTRWDIYVTHYYFRFMSAILFPFRTKFSPVYDTPTKSCQDILPFGENRIEKFGYVPEIVGEGGFRSPLVHWSYSNRLCSRIDCYVRIDSKNKSIHYIL